MGWTWPSAAAVGSASGAVAAAGAEGGGGEGGGEGVVGYSLMTFVLRNGLAALRQVRRAKGGRRGGMAEEVEGSMEARRSRRRGQLCCPATHVEIASLLLRPPLQSGPTYAAYVDNLVHRSWKLPTAAAGQVGRAARPHRKAHAQCLVPGAPRASPRPPTPPDPSRCKVTRASPTMTQRTHASRRWRTLRAAGRPGWRRAAGRAPSTATLIWTPPSPLPRPSWARGAAWMRAAGRPRPSRWGVGVGWYYY
jgi:hypothetical protein